MDTLKQYYNHRANIYEAIYEKPECQEDLAKLKDWLSAQLSDRRILEIACGTGYWTRHLSKTAHSIYATDQSEETLSIAQSHPCTESVTYAQDDAYALKTVQGKFDAAFAGFWFSHLSKSSILLFLQSLHHHLTPQSRVVFIDNNYVEGSSTPLSRKDEEGNTYQFRMLPDGSRHEILKNFPKERELVEIFKQNAQSLQMFQTQYYWGVSYEIL